jgi:ribonuclease G
MPSELLVSRLAGWVLAAVREGGETVEIHVRRDGESGAVGDVFLGRVTRVLPGIRSAFVDIGLGRDAFLHGQDVLFQGEGPPSVGAGRRTAEERLVEGRSLMVQVRREASGPKGPRVTCHVSLPGRHLVYLPKARGEGVSKRIEDPDERERLRALVEPMSRGSGGFVVRTAGRGAVESELRADAAILVATWEAILRRAASARPPARVHDSADVLERLLRDAPEEGYARVVVDDDEDRARAVRYLGALDPELAVRVRMHVGPKSLCETEGIDRDLDRALRPKVWLPSGAFLVIQPTEALVAVDVNTGRFLGKKTPEDTALATNLEAAAEIARQVRLRDLGGIVVVDFIDMEREEHFRSVVTALENALARDRVHSRVAAFGGPGLVAITRKRGRRGLASQLLRPCPLCLGQGSIKGAELVAREALDEARRVAAALDRPNVVVRAHPDVARAIEVVLGCAAARAGEPERISTEGDLALAPDQFDVLAR